jgi:ABC-type sugar transport system permease subunit
VFIEKLSEVHKDQRFAVRTDRPNPARAATNGGETRAKHNRAASAGPSAAAGHATPLRVMALKWTFLAVACGLIASTCLGLWMALLYNRRKRVALALLIAGAVLPVLILAL